MTKYHLLFKSQDGSFPASLLSSLSSHKPEASSSCSASSVFAARQGAFLVSDVDRLGKHLILERLREPADGQELGLGDRPVSVHVCLAEDIVDLFVRPTTYNTRN